MLPAELVILIAQAPPAPGADRGEEFGKTSPIALVVVLLLGLATALLIRSMPKRLRNVPASFAPPDEPGPDATDGPRDAPVGPADTPTTPGGRAGPEG